ncbi:hypothetical protein N7486_000797 [Penicillium sp. IBT 16267x]|nr:hypothetical protein N7486_000797 [Penicillium sp. IBT 16267x]
MRPIFSFLQRTAPTAWTLPTRVARNTNATSKLDSIYTRCRPQQRRQFTKTRELTEGLLDVDNPAKLVRVNQKHGPGLIILGLRSPLPPRIDPDAIAEFDYRRVYATGHFRHDKEMLIGPRMLEGEDGFMVVTPLERADGQSTVLVNRGWISRKMADQKDRPNGLPEGEVTVEGLLREPWKKNMFTPDNKPLEGKFYFPDIAQMAELSGSQPVWIESTMVPDLLESYDRLAKGMPIGRTAEVTLRNNHAEYIFTWFGLSLATSIMLWMLIRKKPNDALRRVRQNKNW